MWLRSGVSEQTPCPASQQRQQTHQIAPAVLLTPLPLFQDRPTFASPASLNPWTAMEGSRSSQRLKDSSQRGRELFLHYRHKSQRNLIDFFRFSEKIQFVSSLSLKRWVGS